VSPGRFLLAFDTSTPVGSIAVAGGEEILARGLLVRRGEHASQLLPRIAELLEEAGLEARELHGLVVGRGPGSFTGVRIAAATARGLSTSLELPLWALGSLAAGAASIDADLPATAIPEPHLPSMPMEPDVQPGDLPEGSAERPRYVLFDARGDRVYAACYRFSDRGMETLVAPRADTLPGLLSRDVPDGALFCGDGALRHAPLLAERGHPVLGFPAGLPTGEGLLRVLRARPDAAPEPQGSRWEPDYLRGGWIEAGRTAVVGEGA